MITDITPRRVPASAGDPTKYERVTAALVATLRGVTVDATGAPYRGSGILVALPDHGVAVWAPSRETVAEWVARVAPVVTATGASPGRFYGAWADARGTLHLDVVEAWSDAEEDEALRAAHARGQCAVFHAGRQETIFLG